MMCRIHNEDLIGHILISDDADWEHLVIPPETLRIAEEATKRKFTGDIVAAGVDFILNCPLGED